VPTYYEDIVTRGYEADPTRRVPLPMVFQYLEHLRWRSIIDPASGLGPYMDLGHFFVVHRQRLVLHRAFGQDTPVRAYMWATRLSRSAIDISHEVRRLTDGIVLARAEVTGVWLGPNRRMARLPEELGRFAESLTPPPAVDEVEADCHATRLESSYIRPPDVEFPRADMAIDAPDPSDVPADALTYRCRVRPSDLDMFAHVNAATYLRYCDDARAISEGVLGDEGRAPAYRAAIHYARETVEGEEVTVRHWRTSPGTLAFVLEAHGVVRATATMNVTVEST
jgi:acyl-CoA thioesterase FadM